jgi:hypothetical protein
MVDHALTDDRHSSTEDPKSPPPRDLRPRPPETSAPRQYRLSPLSWIVFLILMAWNIWSFVPKQTLHAALPYSAFKEQVAIGNVSQVLMVGDEVTGTFVHAVVWPAAKAADAKTAGEEPKAGEERIASGEQKPATYSTFRAAFPSAIGDVSLMPLLEAHHVVTDVVVPSTPRFAVHGDQRTADRPDGAADRVDGPPFICPSSLGVVSTDTAPVPAASRYPL